MKKSVSLLLCMVLVFAMLPSTVAFGTIEYTEGIYTYTVENGKATIISNGARPLNTPKQLVIPSELGGYPVVAIGNGAFYRWETVEEFIVPSNILSIGNYAFTNCPNLISITVSPDNPNFCSVDGHLFNKDKTVFLLYGRGCVTIANDPHAMGCYEIPNSVTTIGDSAFFENSIWKLTIPESVTTIEENAFGFTPDITDIYYTGSKSQWEKILIGKWNDDLENTTIHFGISGTKGTTNSTSDDAPIIAAVTSGATDLFSNTKTVAKNSTEQITLNSTLEETENETVELYLVQDTDTKVKFSGNTLTIQPGQVFKANQPIYLMAVNTETGKSTARQTTLWVSSGTPTEKSYDSKILNTDEIDGKSMVNSVACNNSEKDVTASVYTAVYDKDGNFKGGGVRKTWLEKHTDTAVDIELPFEIEPGDTVKTFFWENMLPLTQTDSVTKK